MSGFQLPELPSNNTPRIWHLKKKAKEEPALYSWLYDPSGDSNDKTKLMLQPELSGSPAPSDDEHDDNEEPFDNKWSKFGHPKDLTLPSYVTPKPTEDMDLDEELGDDNDEGEIVDDSE